MPCRGMQTLNAGADGLQQCFSAGPESVGSRMKEVNMHYTSNNCVRVLSAFRQLNAARCIRRAEMDGSTMFLCVCGRKHLQCMSL